MTSTLFREALTAYGAYADLVLEQVSIKQKEHSHLLTVLFPTSCTKENAGDVSDGPCTKDKSF